MSENYVLFQVSCKVILLNEGKDKVLLLKYNDGFVGIPGGHIEEGESLEDAISRELMEELGIDYDGELKLVSADKYHPKSTKTEKVDLYFAGILNENASMTIDDNKDYIIAWEWVSIEKILEDDYEDWLVNLARKVAEC